MTDDNEPQPGMGYDATWRNAPLPPVGSFEADMVRPRLGHVKLGVIDGDLWMWPEIGEPELVPWTEIGLVGQRGSLVKLDWGPSETLLEFPSNTIALEFSALVEENQLEPDRARDPSESPSLDADGSRPLAKAQHRGEPPQSDSLEPGASPRKSLLRRIASAVVGIIIVVLAAAGGIVAGQRLIGDGPATAGDSSLPVVIREASGDGPGTLGTFVVDGPWRVLWDNQSEAPLTILATSSDGTSEVIVEGAQRGEESAFGDMVGRVTIDVDADGAWRVAVVERDSPD